MERRSLQKTNTILIFCFLVIAGLYFGSSILIPFTFAVFFSTLVLPISQFLERKWKFGRLLSAFISTIVLLICISLVLFLLFRQFTFFVSDLMERKDEISGFLNSIQQNFMSATGITVDEQKELFKDRLGDIFKEIQSFLSSLVADFVGMVLSLLIIHIYVFLLLINRDKFVLFLMKYIPKDKKEETREILRKTKRVAYKYLWGRIQVMLILGVLYSITFYAFGLEYALLLIIFGVIITIIPYVGPFISGVLPILFMILFNDNNLVIVSFAIIVVIIQLIESYVLEPVIIGSEVHQSPLFVIIAIVTGGAIWGAAGLILFVPIFGILKILFDHTPQLKPLGFLIGYKRPGASKDFMEKIKDKFK